MEQFVHTGGEYPANIVPQPFTDVHQHNKSMNLVKASTFALVVFLSATAHAAVSFDWAVIGNPGNAPDTRYNGISVGSVDHDYQIAKFEVTAGQYTEFLNAVAKADPAGLYSTQMANLASYGSNILRTGSSGNFSYSVAPDWANRPVNYVSFWDAARFVNWLHNGQPTGPLGPATTETGAYADVGEQASFARQPGARFFIATEDEWYKAAYHDKNAGLAATYFDYPTGANSVPGTDATESTNPGNNANYRIDFGMFAIGPPYYRTAVGEYELSDSPYGTFDQGGNVWEWNETVAIQSTWRGMLGGGWEAYGFQSLRAQDRNAYTPHLDRHDAGFRVASLPGLAGDFNNDGRVDAADYVVWRKSGINGEQGYSDWRANFGRTASSGAVVTASFGIDTVPEPASLIPISIGVVGLLGCGSLRPRRSSIRKKLATGVMYPLI
jgi:formylglycine-generating enzyme required for sulfatase activity